MLIFWLFNRASQNDDIILAAYIYFWFWNGRVKKRGCFGAASLKMGEESSKFHIAFFCSTFSSTIYIRFFDILAAENKNHLYNRLILKKVINFFKEIYF
jgi:hypothetical protein